MTTTRGSGCGIAGGAGWLTFEIAPNVRVANQTTIKLVGMLAATPATTPTITAIASAESR
jgi:hypothetical protein